MAKARRSSRAAAIQMLYPLNLAETQASEVAEQAIDKYWSHFEAPVEARTYADELVRGVAEHLAGIDRALEQASTNWRLERMAKVDLAILRVAAYELLFAAEVPAEVAIDEAIELTKTFSSADASSFVNGVLAPLVSARKQG